MLPVLKSKRGGGTNNQDRGRIPRKNMKEEFWLVIITKETKQRVFFDYKPNVWQCLSTGEKHRKHGDLETKIYSTWLGNTTFSVWMCMLSVYV